MPSASSSPARPSGPPKFTVAICGGGIAGLTLALALQKMSAGDIRVEIYEAARKYGEIGVGVGMLKRPWQVLKWLGLAEDMAKCAAVPQDEEALRLLFDVRKSDQPEGMRYYEILAPFGLLTFHRADFLKVLVSHLDANVTTSHFSRRLASYETAVAASRKETGSGRVKLCFEDGSSATCDVLIGADGIRSPTRRCLLKRAASDIADSDPDGAERLLSKINPVWSGSIMYRSVIPSEDLERVNPEHRCLRRGQLYTGKSKHLTCYPITHGSRKLVNLGAICSWPEKENTVSTEYMDVCPGDKEEARAYFAGWETEVRQLLECSETVTRWPMMLLSPLQISSHGHIAIIGDADAYVLAGLLAHSRTTLATVPVALKVYETVRLEHANQVHRLSRRNGRLVQFEPETVRSALQECPSGAGDGDTVDLGQIGAIIYDDWKWSWTTDVEEDLNRALEMLTDQLA